MQSTASHSETTKIRHPISYTLEINRMRLRFFYAAFISVGTVETILYKEINLFNLVENGQPFVSLFKHVTLRFGIFIRFSSSMYKLEGDGLR